MNREHLERLARLVALTEDDELSCSRCFELLPRYVDLEIDGAAPDTHVPGFRQHLEQCGACREEYETLREIARLEGDGR